MLNFSRRSTHSIAFGAAALLLAACSGATQSQLTPSGNTTAPGMAGLPRTLAMRMASSSGISPAARSNHKASWMSRSAARVRPLLYSSNALTNEVDVYAVNGKSNTLLGQLTGFNEPYGLCSDASGNVYVTNLMGNNILEYAHGGTSPIKTLSDSYGEPNGCAVSPKTGDLAVTNFEGGPSGQGSLVVYAGGSGSGTLYSVGSNSLVWAPVYDSRGALFFETQDQSSRAVTVFKLPHGKPALETISMPSGVTIYSPSGATWDGKYLGVTDEDYENGLDEGLYRVSIHGTTATLVSQIEYTDSCYYSFSLVVQPIIWKGYLIGGNFFCYYNSTYHLDYWNYLMGGNPVKYIDGSPTSDTSYGQTISR